MYYRANKEASQGPGFPRENQHSGNTAAASVMPPLPAANVPFQTRISQLYFQQRPQPQPQQRWQSSNNGSQTQEHAWAHQWYQQSHGNTRTILHGGGPGENTQFAPRQVENRIIQIGEGTTTPGQSSEYFQERPRVSLCFQCCKWIPLSTLISTRGVPCGKRSCDRAKAQGLQFIPVPEGAFDACEEFKVLLAWWMDKVDMGVSESVEERARIRVLETRAQIPLL
ncbi:hypothetical protein F5Y10DRAFT_284824 [Nemania abortiva]|nr:hypothetical protein F5Y10DRAFT_284824 [Nemania abortiva]